MGGLGSGRQFGKRTTSQLSSVNIKNVSLYDRQRGAVSYQYTKDGQLVRHDVQLTQTTCNYGGVRYWFSCEYCRGRVGILYFSGGQCACRKCFKLAYQSERDSWHNQQFRKADNIRDRLGWRPGIAHADGAKPKGMHWKTFYALKTEHDFRVQRIFGHTMEWCAKIKAGQKASL